MASLRAVRPLVRQVPRAIAPPRVAARRFLNTETAPSLTSTHAIVTGGRAEGHIESETLQIDLGMPKALGGTGDKSNPEELFAAGYGACFQSAMSAVAPTMDIKLPQNKNDSIVESTVDLVGDLKALDLGLRVNMKIKVKGVDKATLEKLVEKTKTVCPYSRATQGNISTTFEVETM